MRWADLAVIFVYLIGITWFGSRFRKGQRNLRDYFLGGRNAPWWAIAFSIVSAETSTLTVIGTPALGYAGQYGFLQVVIGYLLARIIIATLFLPQYFRGEMFTAYELMQRRFGPRIRKFTAGTFLILRALAEGVRVFAISIVISIVLGTGEFASIVLIVCLTLFYTFEGGMTAVIWTDVVQMFLYVGGALVSLFVVAGHTPGGWGNLGIIIGNARVFDFGFSLTPEFFSRTYSFWAGLIGGAFLTTASHGTEQLMVQRLLAARNERESRLALFSSWAVIFFQFSLFLVIGGLLAVFYRVSHHPVPSPPDSIYPSFIWEQLPPGVAGLVIAAILAAAMSNLSAALNSLASTTIMDFYKPILARRHPERADDEARLLWLARVTTLIWGGVLLMIAFISRNVRSVLEAGLSIASILYGALLGVFLLGILTRGVGERAAIAGMLASVVAMGYVNRFTSIAWTWYVLIGTAVTMGVALLVSALLPEPKRA